MLSVPHTWNDLGTKIYRQADVVHCFSIDVKMSRFSLSLILVVAACAPSPGRSPSKQPNFVERLVHLPDGTIEILVSDRVLLPHGAQVKSIDMRERLKRAAAAECRPEPATVISEGSASMDRSMHGTIKFTYKGIVRCG